MSLPEGWLEMAIVRDDRAELVESIQGRQFLRGGIKPTVGQRVDLNLNLTNREGKRPNINMSGFVTSVLPEPSYYPQTSQDDEEGSMMLSQILGHSQFRPPEIPNGMEFHKCQCPEPDCDNGVIFMPRNVWDLVSAEDSPTHCLYQHNVARFAELNTGAKHGQEVICEGRLHFDHDIRRGSVEGPWGDEIPFDGRDVWQFTLVLDDHKQNFWVAKPDSFVNLGRDRHPRCWPWSDETDLPYEYDGVDREDIHDNYMTTLCIGPFGCPGEDHPHDFAGAA